MTITVCLSRKRCANDAFGENDAAPNILQLGAFCWQAGTGCDIAEFSSIYRSLAME